MKGLLGGLIEAKKTQNTEVDESQLVCPHCQTRGTVVRKGGYSDKTRSALSVMASGLLRWDTIQMHCSNCGMDWTV